MSREELIDGVKNLVGLTFVVLLLCVLINFVMSKAKESQAIRGNSSSRNKEDYDEYRQRQQTFIDMQNATDRLSEVNNPK